MVVEVSARGVRRSISVVWMLRASCRLGLCMETITVDAAEHLMPPAAILVVLNDTPAS